MVALWKHYTAMSWYTFGILNRFGRILIVGEYNIIYGEEKVRMVPRDSLFYSVSVKPLDICQLQVTGFYSLELHHFYFS